MNTVQEPLSGAAFDPPSFPIDNFPEQVRTEEPTKADHPARMVIPSKEPSPELSAHDPVEPGTDQLPERCQCAFSDGRQCRMPRSEIHPSLCRFHSEREDQLFGDPAPFGGVVGASLDLPELYSACRDLTTAAGVNRALGQVFRLLAQRRISRHLTIALGSSGSAAKGYPQDALSPHNKVYGSASIGVPARDLSVPAPVNKPAAYPEVPPRAESVHPIRMDVPSEQRESRRAAVCAPDAFVEDLSVSSPVNHVKLDRGNALRSSATTRAEKKSPVLGPPGRDLPSCRAESPLPQDSSATHAE